MPMPPAGGCLGILNYEVNLARLGNAIALWCGLLRYVAASLPLACCLRAGCCRSPATDGLRLLQHCAALLLPNCPLPAAPLPAPQARHPAARPFLLRCECGEGDSTEARLLVAAPAVPLLLHAAPPRSRFDALAALTPPFHQPHAPPRSFCRRCWWMLRCGWTGTCSARWVAAEECRPRNAPSACRCLALPASHTALHHLLLPCPVTSSLQLWPHILILAYGMVLLSAAVLTPFILFVLGFSSRGWNWIQGAVLAAMLAPTDAVAGARPRGGRQRGAARARLEVASVIRASLLRTPAAIVAVPSPLPRRLAPRRRAVTAILKAGGGPEAMVVLMEGEALLNDASAVTLYTGAAGRGRRAWRRLDGWLA